MSDRPPCRLCGCKGSHEGPPDGKHCELLKRRSGRLIPELCTCPRFLGPQPAAHPRPLTLRRMRRA